MALKSRREVVCAHVVRILRIERERQCLSMTVLAKRAGLSQAMISFVERELRNPTLDTLLRVSEVLEIDFAVVLSQAQKEAKAGAK